jgi:hypothetical protein
MQDMLRFAVWAMQCLAHVVALPHSVLHHAVLCCVIDVALPALGFTPILFYPNKGNLPTAAKVVQLGWEFS